jgi:hypothetical protein
MTEDTEVKEVGIDTLPLADFKKARAEGKETVEQKVAPVEEETETTDEEKQDKPKSKGGFQKRIDRLVKHNTTLEEKIAALEAAKSNGKVEEKEAAPAVKGEPKREDFQTEIEYVKALTRWQVKDELRQEREEEEKAQETANNKKIADTYNGRVSEAKSRYDDWDEVINQDIPIPNGVGAAILRMENGPDVAYAIGKDAELREELLNMDPLQAIGRAWEISKGLVAESKASEKEEAAEKEEIPKKKTSGPIEPVTGGTTRSTVALDKMDHQAYKKARAAGRIH